jgi:integrase
MDLIRHYESTELADKSDTVAFSTKAVYKTNLKNWIEPKWGGLLLRELEELPGVHVENWLKTVDLSTGTKAKVRNILSALCSHAMRYGWMKNHPIKGKVRQSAKTTRVQVALEVEELHALYEALELQFRVMLLLDVASGMRRGELLALQWMDFDFQKKTMSIHKAIWHQQVGPVKTMESERVMPLDDEMIADLLAWLGLRVVTHEGQATALARGRDEEPHPAGCRACRNYQAHHLAFVQTHVFDVVGRKWRGR